MSRATKRHLRFPVVLSKVSKVEPMHYYKRNIGDYAKKAGRLTMLQHGAYTLLMDTCYDREQFPTLDQAMEWTWASSPQEIDAVTFVLRKFFVLEGEVFIQKRTQEEIDDFHGKSEINRRIALERESKRREKRSKPDDNPDAKPPKTSTKTPALVAPDGVDEAVWRDFLALRKTKKSALTQTALDGIQREAGKAGWTLSDALQECCARGWTGFNAGWVAGKVSATHSRQDALEKRNRTAGNEWANQGEPSEVI